MKFEGDRSSSPGFQKGTFGTPIGIKKQKKEFSTLFHFGMET